MNSPALALLILLPALAGAAPVVDTTQAPKQDLKDIRQQITTLEKDVKAKEANRAEASDALRASEVAISEANRTLSGPPPRTGRRRRGRRRHARDCAR